MKRLPLILLIKKLFRLISFFLLLELIILLPKVWINGSSGISAAEPFQILQKQSGKKVEFNTDQNLISQITSPKVTVPSDTTDQTTEKTSPDLKKTKKMKLTLESAINQALKANRGLKDVMDQVEGARLSLVAVESEFELKIVPSGEVRTTGGSDVRSADTLGAGISLLKKMDVGTDISITPQTRKTDDFYNTGVDTTLIQPLLRGFGRCAQR